MVNKKIRTEKLEILGHPESKPYDSKVYRAGSTIIDAPGDSDLLRDEVAERDERLARAVEELRGYRKPKPKSQYDSQKG